MWLAFPSLFNFGGVSKVPTKFKSTCHIISSQRVVIFGERRIGKTSAVYEAMSRCKNVRMLYVDLLGIKSVDGMCRRILKAIVVHEQKKGWFEKIFKVLAHLRPSISVDPVTSLPTVSFDSSTDRLLTNIQLKVLAAIAREGGKQVFSAAFMKPSGFTNPSTVRRAVNRLLQLNILFESSGEYRFVNPFFRAWIISRG
jgi:hypothetical protein